MLFVLGCCVGAALNIGIYRLAWTPRPIGPWSSPHPKAPPRRLWDRLPVIGWLGLRRESKWHGAGFWIRPISVELLTGAVFALLYWWEALHYGILTPEVRKLVMKLDPGNIGIPTIGHEQFVAHVVLFCFMLVAFWIDIDEMTIPDGVTIPGTLIGLVIMTLCFLTRLLGISEWDASPTDVDFRLADVARRKPLVGQSDRLAPVCSALA